MSQSTFNRLCLHVKSTSVPHAMLTQISAFSNRLTFESSVFIDYLPSCQYAILKIKMLCNLGCVKARLRLLCLKLLTTQQLESRFKTAKVM